MKNNRYVFCSEADIPEVSGLAMCTGKHPSKYDKRKSFIILVYKQRCNVRDFVLHHNQFHFKVCLSNMPMPMLISQDKPT